MSCLLGETNVFRQYTHDDGRTSNPSRRQEPSGSHYGYLSKSDVKKSMNVDEKNNDVWEESHFIITASRRKQTMTRDHQCQILGKLLLRNTIMAIYQRDVFSV